MNAQARAHAHACSPGRGEALRYRTRVLRERAALLADALVDSLLKTEAGSSEACANAVEHPVRPRRHGFEVEATRTADEIELIVRDFGSWGSSEHDDMRGRGLGMIRELMDETEIVSGDHETAIVMRRARR